MLTSIPYLYLNSHSYQITYGKTGIRTYITWLIHRSPNVFYVSTCSCDKQSQISEKLSYEHVQHTKLSERFDQHFKKQKLNHNKRSIGHLKLWKSQNQVGLASIGRFHQTVIDKKNDSAKTFATKLIYDKCNETRYSKIYLPVF